VSLPGRDGRVEYAGREECRQRSISHSLQSAFVMKIPHPERRLEKFWGAVDRKHVGLIGEWIPAGTVLDVGCGYGTTTAALDAMEGVTCIGIDHDPESLAVARRLHPQCNVQDQDCEDLPFGDDTFDAVVLRDVLHHLYREANFDRVRNELIRVAKNGARVIVLDPNVNLMLRVARVIARHRDAECTFAEALTLLDGMNCRVVYSGFNTVYSLPLSGGYVGIDLVPPPAFLQRLILSSERQVERLVARVGLAPALCWRYLIVGVLGK
jgi:SAM-dependent methyltransferase